MSVPRFYNRLIYPYRVEFTVPTRHEDEDSGRVSIDREHPTLYTEDVNIIGPSTDGVALVEAVLRVRYGSGDRVLRSLVATGKPVGIDGEITAPQR